MKKRSSIGILFILLGVGLFFLSNYIQAEVDAGRGQISAAQSSVDKGKSLFSFTPVTKEVGKGLFGGIQQKINEGKEEADRYETIAKTLKVAALVSVVVGVWMLITGRKKKR